MSSNLIKAYSVSYDAEKVKPLKFTEREEDIANHLKDLISPERYASLEMQEEKLNNGFVQGIAARPVEELEDTSEQPVNEEIPAGVDLETLRAEIKEELRSEIAEEMRIVARNECDSIIADANNQAEGIIAKATAEAEAAKEGIIKLASSEAYEEGLAKAKREEEARLNELDSEKRRLEEEYERRVSELEPAFVKILSEYVRKITGITYENHKDILLYLVDRALRQDTQSKSFTVFMSTVDFEDLSESFEGYIEKYSDKITLRFKADVDLEPGDIRLENDQKVVWCGIPQAIKGIDDAIALISTAE
ncbi:MAG: hypothetical protein K6B75_06925 [Lachnospiraceae bacterium]|nr:hypothetical protein [Lachnospiraceae bacterium]